MPNRVMPGGLSRMDRVVNSPKVIVSIAHSGEEALLERTLRSLADQGPGNLSVRVTGISRIAKTGGHESLQEAFPKVVFLDSMPMAGMARAHNRVFEEALGGGNFEFVLVLEAGVVLGPRFIDTAVAAFGMSDRLGQVACLLTALARDDRGEVPAVIVSGGTGVSPERRTYDLFEGSPADGAAPRVTMVFGAHQACAFYRTAMLREAAMGGNEVFDEDFIGPKAGLDLSWRAQLMGWNAVLIPSCRAFLVPEANLAAPFDLGSYRRLSYRNRYLMILKNDFLGNLASRGVKIFASEAGINFYSILFEPSLLFGLPLQPGALKLALARRKETMSRRRRSRVEMEKILALKK